jgi:hypothetical protein
VRAISMSQRGQVSGHTQLRQRLSSLVKCPLSHAQRRPERDRGHGVAGSNPTGRHPRHRLTASRALTELQQLPTWAGWALKPAQGA